MRLVAGPASVELARKVSEESGIRLVEVEHKIFPDGESYFRYLEPLDGEHIVIIQGTHLPQDKHVIQLCLLAMGAKDLGARRVTAVVPYLAYAKQDRMFKQWEVVSIDVILKLLRSASIEDVITVNMHSPWVIERSPVKIYNADATELLSRYLLHMDLKRPIILSPGKKGDEMSSVAASAMHADHGVIRTRRDLSAGEVEVSLEGIDVRDRDIVVLDDMISTGGTMVKSVSRIKAEGAKRVIVGCVHAAMVGGADKKILSAGADMIISTDTIPNDYAKVSVAKLLAEKIMGL